MRPKQVMCLYLDSLLPCHCQTVHKEKKKKDKKETGKLSYSVLCFPKCMISGQGFLVLFWMTAERSFSSSRICLDWVSCSYFYILSLSKYLFCFHSLLMACMKKEWLKMFTVAPWRVCDRLILEWVHPRVQWTSIAKVYPYCACSVILGPLVPQRVCSSMWQNCQLLPFSFVWKS